VAENRSAIETARRVVQLLEQAGHEVLTRHLVDDNAWEADRQISPKEIYLRDMNWLREQRRVYRRLVDRVLIPGMLL